MTFSVETVMIGPNTFITRHEEQSQTPNLLPEDTDKPAVWGRLFFGDVCDPGKKEAGNRKATAE